MNLVEIEKPASRWQGREGRRSDQTPRVDSTRMQLDTESRMGIAPVFSQSFGKYRKDERVVARSVCKCKKTKGRKSTIFAARQTGAEVREKAGRYFGWGGSGAKKDLQVIENTRRRDVIGGAGCGASETLCRSHNGGWQETKPMLIVN